MRSLPAGFVLLLWIAGGCAPSAVPQNEGDVFSDVRQLTTRFAQAGGARWSPDMRWVLFRATPAGERADQMYLAKLRWRGDVGTGAVAGVENPVRLSPPGSHNAGGAFSPDGRSILFASTAAKPGQAAGLRPAGMELFRYDNWLAAVGAGEPGRGVDLTTRPITDNDAYDADPAYTPDGRFVVFASDRAAPADADDRSAHLDLYAMRPDGTDVVRLTSFPGLDAAPAVSPDGRRVAWHADHDGDGVPQLVVADLARDGRGDIVGLENPAQVTGTRERPGEIAGLDTAAVDARRAPAANLSWHAFGRFVAYASGLAGTGEEEVFQVRPDGRRNLRLTFTPGPDTQPAFSPDGRWLLWTTPRGREGTPQIWTARYRVPGAS